MKFEVGQVVKLLLYANDKYNKHGRIQSYNKEKGMYWVVNMNMPWQGTVSDYFTEYELEALND